MISFSVMTENANKKQFNKKKINNLEDDKNFIIESFEIENEIVNDAKGLVSVLKTKSSASLVKPRAGN